MTLAEDYYGVVRDDLRVTVDQYSFAGTNDTADGCFGRQIEVFDLAFGDDTAFFGIKLHDLGISTR